MRYSVDNLGGVINPFAASEYAIHSQRFTY